MILYFPIIFQVTNVTGIRVTEISFYSKYRYEMLTQEHIHNKTFFYKMSNSEISTAIQKVRTRGFRRLNTCILLVCSIFYQISPPVAVFLSQVAVLTP